MDTGRGAGRLQTALGLFKAAVLGCLLALVVVEGLRTGAASRAVPGESAGAATDDDGAYARVLARAEAGSGCAGGDAVIRTEAGRLRVVSFATGWAVFNGRRPGELLAVCATQPATAVTPSP